MKYSDFVRTHMQDADVKSLPQKQKMKAVAAKWRAQKGSGGTKVAAQKGGSVKKLGGKGGKRKRIATVAEDEYGDSDGEGILPASQTGGSMLAVADMLGPANEIPISASLAQSGMGGLHAVQQMTGGSAWGDFKYGFSLPFKALKVVAPLASLAL